MNKLIALYQDNQQAYHAEAHIFLGGDVTNWYEDARLLGTTLKEAKQGLDDFLQPIIDAGQRLDTIEIVNSNGGFDDVGKNKLPQSDYTSLLAHIRNYQPTQEKTSEDISDLTLQPAA